MVPPGRSIVAIQLSHCEPSRTGFMMRALICSIGLTDVSSGSRSAHRLHDHLSDGVPAQVVEGVTCSVGGVFESASPRRRKRGSRHRCRIPGVRSSTAAPGHEGKPADSEIVSTAKVSGGYTYSWNRAEEKWHRQARADRCEALTQALPARQAAVEDRDASPRRTHFDRRS